MAVRTTEKKNIKPVVRGGRQEVQEGDNKDHISDDLLITRVSQVSLRYTEFMC